MDSPPPSVRKGWRRSPRGMTNSNEFDLSRQRFALRRDEMHHFKLRVVIGALGHEAVISARRGRHGTQEVSAHELKLLRDLGLARFVGNWLFGAVVDLVNVARGQRVDRIDSYLGDVLLGLHGALFGRLRRWCQMLTSRRSHGSCRHRQCSGSGSVCQSWSNSGHRKRCSHCGSQSRPYGTTTGQARATSLSCSP